MLLQKMYLHFRYKRFFFFFDPQSSRFIKISEIYECADIGAIPHWSTHKTVILAIYTAGNLAGDEFDHTFISSFAGLLGDAIAQGHRRVALVASFGALRTSPPFISTPGAKK